MTQIHHPTVFTIEPCQPFADSLAGGILDKFGKDALSLSSITVLLPNRRAVRALQEAFLRLSDERSMILPNMRPIGDVDEDEITFLGTGLTPDPTQLLPAIDGKQRQILLMQQVTLWLKKTGKPDIAPAQCWRLAGELARLMDQVETERLSFDSLPDLVDEEYAHHWQITLDFLKIIADTWPLVLEEMAVMNPAKRRDALMTILCQSWRDNPPKGTIIAAGSTGTIKATSDLLTLVAHMENGMVVLPGLDSEMGEESWEALSETHPQYALRELLTAMKVSREDVQDWAWQTSEVELHRSRRAALISDALLPAETTHLWQGCLYRKEDKSKLFEGFDLIVTPGRREEAATIAVMMREALESPHKTVALITPDRALATFVRTALGRWGLTVDDSAGEQVSASEPGSLLSLIAHVVADGFTPVILLSLLQHPLVSAGYAKEEFRRFVRKLDKQILRGPRPNQGRNGLLKHATACAKDPKHDFTSASLDVLSKVLSLFDPLCDAFQEKREGAEILTAHIMVGEALCATDLLAGDAFLWRGEAGSELASELESLIVEAAYLPAIESEYYAPLYDEMVSDLVVRPVWRRHPRLYIWGPLEARLQRADLMILGGLNEGTWPSETKSDPWMSRPMRKDFGLPPLERRIGQSAHDFVQAANAAKVVMTRAEKVDGSPTVPSRWLLRLEALADGLYENQMPHIHYADALDRPTTFDPALAPTPRPPVEARPKRLSVTQIETWMRDPYALYAKKVLDLRPLDPIDTPPNAAQKGTLIHEALERFLAEEGDRYGPKGLERLLLIGREVFKTVLTLPTVYAFWWPRFEHVANWFVENLKSRRESHDVVLIEKWAEAEVEGTGFTLFAKADRIDRQREGGKLEIIDYKTGAPP